MTTTIIGAGTSATGLTVGSGDTLEVLAGGTVTFATIRNGGTVSVAGECDDATVQTGGSLTVSAQGILGAATINGGYATVLNRGTATATTVAAGGLNVNSGGVAYATIVQGTGAMVERSGGLSFDTVVDGGCRDTVDNNGTATGAVLNGGTQALEGGAIAVGTTVESDGELDVALGGTSYASVVDAGGNESVLGYASGAQVLQAGLLAILSGGEANGTDVLPGGVELIDNGAEADDADVAGGEEIVFSGGTAVGAVIEDGGIQMIFSDGVARASLIESGGQEFLFIDGTIDGATLQPGAQLDLSFLPFSSDGTVVLDPRTDLLTVVESGETYTATLAGSYADDYFQAALDPTTDFGTLITVEGTPCYCRGTHVLTEAGERTVEDLRIGDRLVTRSGAGRPIVWIGRRSYDAKFAARNRDVLPVCIEAGALADGVPKRDLHVSPLHALLLDDVLVPAAALVNGTSIRQVVGAEPIVYYHVELATHDVILAEGAWAETFVDDDSRAMFHNAGEFTTLYPDQPRIPASYCAPRVEDGEEISDLRRRLAARLPVTAGPLSGRLDEVARACISGWARDASAPDARVRLRVSANGTLLGQVVADRFRPDLLAAGIGDGHHGFELIVPGGLSPDIGHVIDVSRASDRVELPNSPWLLQPSAECPVARAPVTADAACRGVLDEVTRARVSGWATDDAAGDEAVAVVILDNDRPIARVVANLHRPDLAHAGIDNGRHGFAIDIPDGLSPLSRHVIRAWHERTGTELAQSPTIIEPSGSFDRAVERAVADAVAAATGTAERDRILSFLAGQAERLLQQGAEEDSQRSPRRAHKNFLRRWGVHGGAPDMPPDPGARALIVAARPAASDARWHMSALQRLGYAVSVAATEPADLPDLRAAGAIVCAPPCYASVEEVLRRQAGCFDLIYLLHTVAAAAYLWLARTHCPTARIVYVPVALDHRRLERQAADEARPELLALSRRTRLEECTAAWRADAVLLSSQREAELLRRLVPGAEVHTAPMPPHASRDPCGATTIDDALRRALRLPASHLPKRA